MNQALWCSPSLTLKLLNIDSTPLICGSEILEKLLSWFIKIFPLIGMALKISVKLTRFVGFARRIYRNIERTPFRVSSYLTLILVRKEARHIQIVLLAQKLHWHVLYEGYNAS